MNWIELDLQLNYSPTQAQKTFWCLVVRLADSQARNLGSIPGQDYEVFVNFILLNSSN